MAKILATVSGTALKPGASKNRRYYSPEAVAGAVVKAQKRLAEGTMPLSMRSHHAAEDDSTRIVGRVTSLKLAEDGSARFTADIADTPHGRTIASLLDTSGGEPFLTGVSIRGAWDGQVRRIKGDDGEQLETGDSLSLEGLDYTATPGIPAARIDAFSWAKDGATETTERVLITESVQEARVTISEEAAPAEEAAAQTPAPAGTTYADPGYLKDKKKRYPLNSDKRIRAAWSYANQKDNAAQYTPPQLKRIKGKIRAAMKRIGATVTAEGWVIWPADAITETAAEVDEHYPDDVASPAGSLCVEASNGPICIRISSYCVDPADLDLILRNACEAADVALRSFDPDMDAPGESTEDEDGLSEATEDPAPESPAAEHQDSKEPVMAEAATQEAARQALAEAQIPVSAGDPGSTGVATNTNNLNNNNMARNADDDVAGNSLEQFLQDMIQMIASKAGADGKINPAYARLAAQLAMSQALGMSGPQGSASVALVGAGSVPAPPVSAESAPQGGTVTETEAQMIERIVRERMAPPAPVEESAEQRIERLVTERLVSEKARLTESGQGPSRKGLVAPVRESAASGEYSEIPAEWPQKDLKDYTAQEWKTYVEPHVAGSVFGTRGAAQPA